MNYIAKKASSFTVEERALMGITGIPLDWIVEKYIYEDTVPVGSQFDGFELLSEEEIQVIEENNQAAYDAWLQALRPISLPVTDLAVSVKSVPPFAEPLYRTKRDGTDSWTTCPEDTNTVIDFIMGQERYLTGGEIIYFNAKKGDYISAEVNDPDGVIPEAYRAALCEDYPTVARYILKKWLLPSDGYEHFLIDTYPLNAKITAGLSLRITYHSSVETGNREAAINYHLTKKL